MDKEALRKDMVLAMQRGDRFRTQVIRMLISEITYGETASKPYDALTAVTRYRKRLVDSLEDYRSSPKKLQEVQDELEIVQEYLPKEPSREEILAFVSNFSRSLALGVLIKEVKSKYPTANGKTISEIAKAYLNQGEDK